MPHFRFLVFSLLSAAVAGSVARSAGAQQLQIHPSPQEASELRRVLSEADAAITGLAPGEQYDAQLKLASMDWQIGDRAATRAEIERARSLLFPSNSPRAAYQMVMEGVGPVLPWLSSEERLADLASRVAQFGDVDDAAELMKGVPLSGKTDSVLDMLAIKQAQAGDFASAERSALQATDANRPGHLFVKIVWQQLRQHDISGALEIAAEMSASPEKVHALVLVSHAQMLAGDRAAASQSVELAVQIASQLPEAFLGAVHVSQSCLLRATASMRDDALEYAAQGEWDLGDHNAATNVRKQIDDPGLREEVLADFVRVDAQSGRFAEAKQLANQISTPACRDLGLRDLVLSGYDAGDANVFIALVNEIHDPTIRSDVCFALASRAASRRDLDSATLFFSKTRETLGAVPGKSERVQTLAFMASEEREAGLRDDARKESAEAVRLTRSVTADDSLDGHSTDWLPSTDKMEIDNLAWSERDFVTARAKALKLEGSIRSESISGVAAAQAAAGDLRGSEAWALSLQSADRSSALLGAADGFMSSLLRQAYADSK
jgi:hypothetical protein